MTADVQRALEADKAIGRMYADPDLRGDLLAVGLALLRLLRNGETRFGLARVAEMVGWKHPSGEPNWLRVKYVLSDDRPRYVPRHGAGECVAPMVRREGTCGAPTGHGMWHYDPATGEMRWQPSCSRHHDWADAERKRSYAEWRANGSPRPPANTGGVLARYINLNWTKVYRWGDPAWQMPSSGPPEPTPQRPRLTLIAGEGEGGVVPDRNGLSSVE